MSYFQSIGDDSLVGKVTVTQTPDVLTGGSDSVTSVDAELCGTVGGKWLNSACQLPDGTPLTQSEVINIAGKAPAQKKFPWTLVLLGAGGLAAVFLLTRKPKRASAPALAQVTA